MFSSLEGIVLSVLQGFNGTICAYGQTGMHRPQACRLHASAHWGARWKPSAVKITSRNGRDNKLYNRCTPAESFYEKHEPSISHQGCLAGSGKTHSLFGDINSASERGIVPRAMAAVSSGVASSKDGCKFSITMSVVEIYCEKIRDLLDIGNENLQVQCLHSQLSKRISKGLPL